VAGFGSTEERGPCFWFGFIGFDIWLGLAEISRYGLIETLRKAAMAFEAERGEGDLQSPAMKR